MTFRYTRMTALKLLSIALLTVFISANTAAADQEFPGYLSDKFCTDTKLDFMTNTIKSLQRYRDTQLADQHRGGMNNIRKLVVQRKEWLLECQSYLSQVESKNLFESEASTESLFAAMDNIAMELQSLISGVTYAVEPGENPSMYAAEKFDLLFKLVDTQKTQMLMKGQVVYR